MTITVDLAPEIEKAIEEAAARNGQDPEELATEITEKVFRVFISFTAGHEIDNSEFFRLLKEAIAPLKAAPATKGAELLAYWQREGLIGTRPEITDSQDHARRLRREAEQRKHD